MKPGIHPEYVETTITCACGKVFQTRATKKNMRVEICSSCHPFFTGSKKIMDTAGRIERFQKRYGKGK
jgi:large subunit ribosomal protein L31